MRFLRVYASGSIAIGILQVIDGILLVLGKGDPVQFNYVVAVFELLWIPVCTVMVFLFKRNKISMLSPYSYVLYNFIGWTIAALLLKPDAAAIPVWFAGIGAAFGIYYVIINDRLLRRFSR